MANKIYLELLDDFKCLMSACPDNCCYREWSLPIDAPTLTQWKNINDVVLRTKLLDSISVVVERNKAIEVLKHDSENRCIHVSDEGLCSIQVSHGHDILPDTCQEYPRVEISNNKTQLKTAHMSCPEVAQLLLTRKLDDVIFQSEDNNKNKQATDISAILEETTLIILSQQQYPLTMRLYLITTIIDKLRRQSKEDSVTESKFAKICQLSSNDIEAQFKDVKKQINKKKLKVNKKVAGLYWQFVMSTCRVFKDPEINNLFEESRSFQQLKDLNNSNDSLTDKNYLKFYHVFTKLHGFLSEQSSNYIDNLLTRYMVVKFKNHGYPWYLYKNNLTLTFLDCIIPFSQINMLLWLIYDNKQSIVQNDVIKIIYKVEKTTAHNTQILDSIENRPELADLLNYAGSWLKQH